MKIQILRVFVLLISISAASVLVWNATRERKSDEVREEGVVAPESMLPSSKLRVIVNANLIKEITPEDDNIVEDQTPNKDTLLFSSKQGPVDSKPWLDMYFKKREKVGSNSVLEAPLMHSSKSFSGPIFKPKDLEKIIEPEKRDPNAEQVLPPQKDPFATQD